MIIFVVACLHLLSFVALVVLVVANHSSFWKLFLLFAVCVLNALFGARLLSFASCWLSPHDERKLHNRKT